WPTLSTVLRHRWVARLSAVLSFPIETGALAGIAFDDPAQIKDGDRRHKHDQHLPHADAVEQLQQNSRGRNDQAQPHHQTTQRAHETSPPSPRRSRAATSAPQLPTSRPRAYHKGL